jgi:hypothetical protein
VLIGKFKKKMIFGSLDKLSANRRSAANISIKYTKAIDIKTKAMRIQKFMYPNMSDKDLQNNYKQVDEMLVKSIKEKINIGLENSNRTNFSL